MTGTGAFWLLGRQVAISASGPKHFHCLRSHIKKEKKIKTMIYRNKVLKNGGEKRVRSTGGEFELGEQTHLHLRLNETEREDKATVLVWGGEAGS